MTKYAVVSTDANPDYYPLIPIVAYSWHKLGYTPIVIMVNCPMQLIHVLVKYCPAGTMFRSLEPFAGVHDSTIAQFSRLFAASELDNPNDILVTGDGDMLIMQDIFHNSGYFENYGHNITGYSEYPICYNSARVEIWKSLFDMGGNLWEDIEANLPPAAYSETWEDYWSIDQQFLTGNVMSKMIGARVYDREMGRDLPVGRWDRYNWEVVPEDIIDVHCIRGLHRWDEITAMAEYLFPGEVGWMGELYDSIKQL